MIAEDQITFLIILNEGDLESLHGIAHYYRKHFGLSSEAKIEDLQSSIYRLEREDVICQFDIEADGDLDSAIYDHSEHGDIKFNDMTIIGLDEKFCLGRRAIDYAFENRDALCEKAIDHGFTKAAAVLTDLPIDSAGWTGLDANFQLNEEIKLKLLKMLTEAEKTLSSSASNDRDVGQGLAFVRSAKILCEAPDPPKRDIWTMINRASSILSIASVFTPILALFGKQ
ncbi:MAG: hypothetical protein WA935_05475 [Sphingopyxis granuli]